MKNRRGILFVLLMIFAFTSCSSVNTMIKKRNLDVQTKMSETIWLEPTTESQRSIYVQIKNTTGKNIQIEDRVKQALLRKGYLISENPNQAHFWLQANILKLDKVDLRNSDPFGAAVLGAGVGASLGLYNTGSVNTGVGLGLAGALISGAVDALVEDTAFTMITDILISEASNRAVRTKKQSKISQGTRGYEQTSSSYVGNRNKYQTRVVSVANQVNLKFEEAQAELERQLEEVIVGIF